jgi:aconitate hydratase
MMRGTFANIRIKNQMVPGVEGGVTRYQPTGEQMSIYDAGMRYQAGRHAARGLRRQGVRHRLVRDWAQGHQAAGRQGRDRRELRAHPPLQPRRHGRPAAAVQGRREPIECLCRIDTDNELEYIKNGGILHYVLRQRAAA